MAHTDEATINGLVRDLIRNSTLRKDEIQVVNLLVDNMAMKNARQHFTTTLEYWVEVTKLIYKVLNDRWTCVLSAAEESGLREYVTRDEWTEIVLQVKHWVIVNKYTRDERIDALIRRMTENYLQQQEQEPYFSPPAVAQDCTPMSDINLKVESILPELNIEIDDLVNRMVHYDDDEYEQEDEVDRWLTMFLDERRKAEVDMCKNFARMMMTSKVSLKSCSKNNHREAHEAARSRRSVTFAA